MTAIPIPNIPNHCLHDGRCVEMIYNNSFTDDLASFCECPAIYYRAQEAKDIDVGHLNCDPTRGEN